MENVLQDLIASSGFFHLTVGNVGMWIIAFVLMYLAIKKGYEPLLLLPIAFGILVVNLPLTYLMQPEEGLIWKFYNYGIKWEIIPPLIFLGLGAMTDFGPVIANPKTLLLGGGAQVGVYVTFFVALLFGFDMKEAASIGIIGGADGPTSIYLTSKLAPHLLGPIAVAAYSYMALVPVIQPPIMKLLTTKDERRIVMRKLRVVSKTEKIVFPVVTGMLIMLIVPASAALMAMFMLGNLFKESGVVERLSKAAQNEIMNTVTIFLGLSVGATMTAEIFLKKEVIFLFILGLFAFSIATASGVLLAKLMNLFIKEKINPLIGAAGVSAVPMAARVVHKVGAEENRQNYLLMHAMGPNVAGVIGTLIAASVMLTFLK
ncbi:sodium ion-translocating decarboxylase subunit beta [Desulfosporosinus sp. BICA1-9]|uniref:sodium ion-translocating decarboxylase subunit beta n=1 Tax=Desulfosporosinus sp. BICA1-9 TaxID=1531958 RepID=UPI00054AFE09|nr:sodium ion-translocating decarboxylase subunit beta [Desulfosporosinus sp. BICA1-9]KJS88850.1 MAG: glutaconyl-CoA decarboxylase subunit beta [Desulfosporosinus sp. BICA1-9]HBW37278.1 sodium ion-translocating decarboxylase subunit beta [Desulfosporosinus sp.]